MDGDHISTQRRDALTRYMARTQRPLRTDCARVAVAADGRSGIPRRHPDSGRALKTPCPDVWKGVPVSGKSRELTHEGELSYRLLRCGPLALLVDRAADFLIEVRCDVRDVVILARVLGRLGHDVLLVLAFDHGVASGHQVAATHLLRHGHLQGSEATPDGDCS